MPDLRQSKFVRNQTCRVDNLYSRHCLAYGTLSNPNNVDKTAEEIRASKQRSYTAVNRMQKSWNTALDDIIAIMDTLCTLYNIVPAGVIDKTSLNKALSRIVGKNSFKKPLLSEPSKS